MSMLNRLRQNAHLDDAALTGVLADVWLSGGSAPTHPHLAHCAACRARLAGFETWLNGLRDEASAEADRVFPPDRLAAQHAQIMRRLDAAERPARVIAFPRFARPISTGRERRHRWIASAAAAGLLVGVAVGQLMDLRHAAADRQGLPIVGQAPDGPARPAARSASAQLSDFDLYVTGVEPAVALRTVSALEPYDQLTPRGSDFIGDPR
jgi:hypothetical protein